MVRGRGDTRPRKGSHRGACGADTWPRGLPVPGRAAPVPDGGQLAEGEVVARGLGQVGRATAALGAALLGLVLTASVADAVVAVPNVAVSIAGGGLGPRVSAASFSWTVVARNDGAATAHDVIVSTTLPAGAVSVSPPPACQVGSSVRCSVGDLSPDGQVRIELIVHLRAGTCGELRSVATISASDEPAIADNGDTAVASASLGCPPLTSDPVLAP